ncbi:hypothetical protein R1sor_008861 [Riccia sorocarpa]|uniref:Reverse transcriptase domain-containing protein n=1 Tax=Riccia sorocarpa TaxID=122646 RepID=A0ABD3H6Y0_9MARC
MEGETSETEEAWSERLWEEFFGSVVIGEEAEQEGSEGAGEETEEGSEWPSATELRPEELYRHLEIEGVLRPPTTVVELIRNDTRRPENSCFWGDWKSKQFRLERDFECTDRVKYNTVISNLAEDSQEVFVSNIWDGAKVPETVGFGSLLEGYDGVYRAGLEVDLGGFRHSKDIKVLNLETGKAQLETVKIRESITLMTADTSQIRVQVDDHATASQLQVTALSTSIIEVRAELCSVRSRGDSQSAVQRNLSSEITLLKDMVEKQSVTSADQAQEFTKWWSELGERQCILTSLEQRLADQMTQLDNRLQTLAADQSTARTPAPDVSNLMEAMEDKLRTYAEVSRSSQTVWLNEREKERQAIASRSRNLRIVGLPEGEEENTQEAVNSLLRDVLRVASPDVEHATRVRRSDKGPRVVLVRFKTVEGRAVALGNKSMLKGRHIWLDSDLTPLQAAKKQKELQKVRDAISARFIAYLRNPELWSKSDVIIFAETWENAADSKIVIPGFSRVASVWNKKKFSRSRGFGGLAVWTRHNIGLDVSVEVIDVRKQYIAVRFSNQKDSRPLFVVASYFAPAESPVYADLDAGTDPYSDISNMVRSLKELGAVYVVGDFNSRTANGQNEDNDELGSPVWQSHTDSWERLSSDSSCNGWAELLIRFARVCDLRILNGTQWFRDSGGFTFSSHTGSSVVDYLLVSHDTRENILNFDLEPFVPESDHRPLTFTIAISRAFRKQRPREHYDLKFFGGCSFSEEEVNIELHRMESGKAVDLNGLSIELLKWGGPLTTSILTQLLNQPGDLPEEWSHRKVVPLYKAGVCSDPGSYRTIMIGNVFARILGRLLDTRLNSWAEDSGIRAPAQAGFRSKHSTLDHGLVLCVLGERAKRTRKTLYVLFIDFSKAFNTISRELLWSKLRQLGAPEDLIATISKLYQTVRIKIQPDDDGVLSNIGVIQGCPASPTLFGLAIDDLYWRTADIELGSELGVSSIEDRQWPPSIICTS